MSAVASADPDAVAKAKRQAQALREQVQELDESLEAAREDHVYAKLQLEETQRAIASNQALLDQAQVDLGIAYERLENRVVNIYRNGRVGLLDALFGADSFGDFINRFELLTLIGVKDSDVLGQVSSFREDVAARKEQLAADQALQEDLLKQAAEASANVEKKLAERTKLLAGKEREVAQLEREEEERQRKAAEEAAKAAEAARKAAQRARQQSPSSNKGSSNGSNSAEPARDVPSSAVGGSVVDVALRYVGVPYVWGGESPSGFDCSGLVKYSFAQVGVSLPHSSRALYNVGVAVARSDLQPGDLVFFGSPIHHVGIYVGGGNMVHAPYTGANVRVNTISRSNYTGARRIL